ncbi:MAG: glycosyl hydrolase [Saprospiraceae bacterium]|nr:glycosyl hydrolase [Saprospiraceae bacterium]
MARIFPLFLFFLTSLHVTSQTVQQTSGTDRLAVEEKRQALLERSWVRHIPFQNVGPSIFSGRVVDLAVDPNDPSQFLVAYASGGLWLTKNNGSSFTPLFDQEVVMTIGAIAADWASGTIWVGTGEVNSSRSSYAGVGMYMSQDTGKTWQYRGLPESHHIGRIILHPDDPMVAWVAVLGHLYSNNPERGIYHTRDGGLTWEHTLFVNDRTGAVDLIMDPKDSDRLFASLWERDRKAWNLSESGPSSGIYQSDDGGMTWTLISTSEQGFPTGEGAGRIGLAMGYQGDQSTLYALIDNQSRRSSSQESTDTSRLSKDELRTMTKAEFLNVPKKKVQTYLEENEFPDKYDADRVIRMVARDSIMPEALVLYIEGANSLLFDTPVVGAEIYALHGNEVTWKKTHDGFLDDIFYSYGYYFGQIRVQADDPDNLYIMGVPVLHSTDGGHTFTSVNAENVHVDHHALWINPDRPDHIILGNDGGVYISQDAGNSWIRANRPPVGQFYSVAVDDADPFHIYGGLQDNGVWKGPSTYKGSLRWEMTGQYPYKTLLGGDGMQIQIDPREEARTVYTGYQFGFYFRVDTQTGEQTLITPKPDLGERPYRWNWQTPIHLSSHNPDILYMGAQKLLRSMDQGRHFEEISADLTKGGRKGDVPYGTLTSIHESPLKFGLIYCGSDDGLIHVTRDGGYSWQRITEGLPEDLWVSRIQASRFVEGRVYVALNGYRWDHFDAYVYRSEDFGKTWERICLELPSEPVNVIREDPANPELLYVGTDHGVYASFDRGAHVMPFDKGLPRVPVHDLVIHPSTSTLVLGTHGRSFFTADLKNVQSLRSEVTNEALTLLTPSPVRYQKGWGKSWSKWLEANVPSVPIWSFSQEDRMMTWEVYPEKESRILLASGEVEVARGLSNWTYDLSISNEKGKKKWITHLQKNGEPAPKDSDNGILYLPPGKYRILLKDKDLERETILEVTQKKRST